MNNSQSSNQASGKTGNPQNIGTPNLVPQNNRLQGSGTNSSSDVITIPAQPTSLPSVSLDATSTTTTPTITTPPPPKKAVNATMIAVLLTIVVVLIAASIRFAQQGNNSALSKR